MSGSSPPEARAPAPRLRVRSAAGEVPLASFQWAAATDPLDEHTLAAVAAGVSTRRYAGTLDPVPADVTERATSSSAVSRRFVALSTKRLQSFLGRPLGELDLRAVCIDGKVFRDHCSVVAERGRARHARSVYGTTAARGGGDSDPGEKSRNVANGRIGRRTNALSGIRPWSCPCLPTVRGGLR